MFLNCYFLKFATAAVRFANHFSFIRNGLTETNHCTYVHESFVKMHNVYKEIEDLRLNVVSPRVTGETANDPWCRKEILLGKSPSYFFTVTK